MLDIAALQHLYGANFATNAGDTVYSWSPWSGETRVDGEVALPAEVNRIFATIWDGGGADTYDLSDYVDDLRLDLRPGQASIFSDFQRAFLGGGPNGGLARGNIFNALQHEGDPRSLIENAVGGSGDDGIRGNAAGQPAARRRRRRHAARARGTGPALRRPWRRHLPVPDTRRLAHRRARHPRRRRRGAGRSRPPGGRPATGSTSAASTPTRALRATRPSRSGPAPAPAISGSRIAAGSAGSAATPTATRASSSRSRSATGPCAPRTTRGPTSCSELSVGGGGRAGSATAVRC